MLASDAESDDQAKNNPPAATHTLPDDPKAAVIIFDSVGGFTPPPQNDDPVMVIRADGSVTLGNRFRDNARVETKIAKEDLQELLRFVVGTNEFFSIDAAQVKQEIAEEVARQNEKLKDQGIARLGPIAIADAPTTVVRVHADGKEHEVRYYALGFVARQYQGIKRLTQLQNTAARLRALEQKLKAGAADGGEE